MMAKRKLQLLHNEWMTGKRCLPVGGFAVGRSAVYALLSDAMRWYGWLGGDFVHLCAGGCTHRRREDGAAVAGGHSALAGGAGKNGPLSKQFISSNDLFAKTFSGRT